MKSGWKNLIGSVVFLAIGFFLLLHLNYVLRPHGTYRKVYPGYYAEENNTIDIVNIGTSAIFRYIDCAHLWETNGYTSYSLATADAPFECYRYVIEEALKSQDPDLFIIDARGILINHDDNDEFEQIVHIITDSMNHNLTRLKVINREVPSLMDRLDYIWELNFYHDNWEELTSKDWKYWDNKAANPMKQLSVVLKVKALDTLTPDGDEEASAVPLSADISENLTELLEYCQKLDTPVLFLETPYRRPAKYDGMSQTLESLVNRYGLDYLDLNDVADEIGLDVSTDFYNTRHTNYWGSCKVTEYLGSWLEKNYDINKTHSDSVTEDWDRAVALENRLVTTYSENKKVEEDDQDLISGESESGGNAGQTTAADE